MGKCNKIYLAQIYVHIDAQLNMCWKRKRKDELHVNSEMCKHMHTHSTICNWYYYTTPKEQAIKIQTIISLSACAERMYNQYYLLFIIIIIVIFFCFFH